MDLEWADGNPIHLEDTEVHWADGMVYTYFEVTATVPVNNRVMMVITNF